MSKLQITAYTGQVPEASIRIKSPDPITFEAIGLQGHPISGSGQVLGRCWKETPIHGYGLETPAYGHECNASCHGFTIL